MLALGHTASKWQNLEMNSAPSDSGIYSFMHNILKQLCLQDTMQGAQTSTVQLCLWVAGQAAPPQPSIPQTWRRPECLSVSTTEQAFNKPGNASSQKKNVMTEVRTGLSSLKICQLNLNDLLLLKTRADQVTGVTPGLCCREFGAAGACPLVGACTGIWGQRLGLKSHSASPHSLGLPLSLSSLQCLTQGQAYSRFP